MQLKPQTLKYGSVILLVLVAILTVLNICTPLRITTDSFRYLDIMEYLNGDLGKDSHAAIDFYPHGYPRLLQWLNSCGLLNAGVLVGINIISVAGAAYLFTKLFPVKNLALFLSFVLLSFINIKHITLPIADQLFTLVLYCSILCCVKGFEKSFLWFPPALLLAIVSIYLRTAGVVLLAGIVLYLLYIAAERIRTKKHFKMIVAVAVVLLVTALVFVLFSFRHKVKYLDQLALQELFTGPATILQRLGYHFKELGEMMINIPVSQLKGRMHSGLVDDIFIAAGLLVLFTILRNVIALKLYRCFPFWVFFSYVAMIFVWPYYDTRFLIPFIPFALYFVFPQFNTGAAGKYLRTATAVIYVVFGLVSLAYSAMLSLDKSKFLKYYGNEPKLTKVYKLHFEKTDAGQQLAAHSDRDTMGRTLYLLDKYDK